MSPTDPPVSARSFMRPVALEAAPGRRAAYFRDMHALMAREEAEDEADPPCGTCHSCLTSERSKAVAGVLATLGHPIDVRENGDRVWIDLFREPDLLAMGALLEALRGAGAQAVRMERWECGSGDEVSSGPRLVAWIVPEE